MELGFLFLAVRILIAAVVIGLVVREWYQRRRRRRERIRESEEFVEEE